LTTSQTFEALILQKFRHKIRDGAISFLFARDGVEALAALKANGQIDLVVTEACVSADWQWPALPLASPPVRFCSQPPQKLRRQSRHLTSGLR
jgi:hypothetical protein